MLGIPTVNHTQHPKFLLHLSKNIYKTWLVIVARYKTLFELCGELRSFSARKSCLGLLDRSNFDVYRACLVMQCRSF